MRQRTHLLALSGYVLLTGVLTWPVLPRLSTHLAGGPDPDLWVFQWNNWWLRQALQRGINPYHTDLLFHPQGVSLTAHSFSWGMSALWLLLESLVGPVAAYNLTLLLTFVLSGYTMYLLAREFSDHAGAAFVAGLVLAFCPYRLSQSTAHISLAAMQWLPLFMLYLVRTVRRCSVRTAVLSGVFLALAGLECWHFLTFAGLWSGLYVVYSLVFERGKWRWRAGALLALAAVVCAALIAPLLIPIVREHLSAGGAGYALPAQLSKEPADLLAYFTPSRLHPLWGQRVVGIYQRFTANDRWIAFVGYGVLALSVYAALRRVRGSGLWLTGAVGFALLALGRDLTIGGVAHADLFMPYRLVDDIILFRMLRHPDRFNLMVMLCLAMVVGLAWADLVRRLPGRTQNVALVALTGLILGEYLALPYPTTEPTVSPFYHQLARDPADYAIIDLPMGRQRAKKYMYFQTIHGKRLVEGMVARTPPEAYAFIEADPLLRLLRSGRPVDSLSFDVAAHRQALAEQGFRYFVLHKDYLPAKTLESWRLLLGPESVYEDDELIVYPSLFSPLKSLSLGASRRVSACADASLLRDNGLVGEGRPSAQGPTG
ncbi:MAG: hypothetical protein H5T62_12440 [Anaerolineae bacterium]|nr:hypothetical protein [Anaerolineae bacterium]